MILPNVQNIIIEETKVAEYLLNPAHPDNGGKAAFFLGWGFTAAEWMSFARAVREMISRSEVADRVQSAWGEKYVVDGTLDAPKGTTPTVRTVWIVDGLPARPRLVTAYPGK